ncbi:unnamed protein product [Protopolystoma xenopodis]|uniref:Uncharacterized protein n=1 Tax=Protopolystoma xenopodis TaxID=117903 RepID=A0A3S5ARL1_9PLAT|nr:unnamed protein product [Protopolystoma xenopodis]
MDDSIRGPVSGVRYRRHVEPLAIGQSTIFAGGAVC